VKPCSKFSATIIDCSSKCFSDSVIGTAESECVQLLVQFDRPNIRQDRSSVRLATVEVRGRVVRHDRPQPGASLPSPSIGRAPDRAVNPLFSVKTLCFVHNELFGVVKTHSLTGRIRRGHHWSRREVCFPHVVKDSALFGFSVALRSSLPFRSHVPSKGTLDALILSTCRRRNHCESKHSFILISVLFVENLLMLPTKCV